jgi:hypothetical protein
MKQKKPLISRLAASREKIKKKTIQSLQIDIYSLAFVVELYTTTNSTSNSDMKLFLFYYFCLSIDSVFQNSLPYTNK